MIPTTQSALNDVLESIVGVLTPDVARRIVETRLSPEVLARLDVVREKAGEGSLTQDEREWYEQCIEAMDVLAIFKSKARQFLKRLPNA